MRQKSGAELNTVIDLRIKKSWLDLKTAIEFLKIYF